MPDDQKRKTIGYSLDPATPARLEEIAQLKGDRSIGTTIDRLAKEEITRLRRRKPSEG